MIYYSYLWKFYTKSLKWFHGFTKHYHIGTVSWIFMKFFIGSSHENSPINGLWKFSCMVFHGHFIVYDPPMKVFMVFHNYHWSFMAYSLVAIYLYNLSDLNLIDNLSEVCVRDLNCSDLVEKFYYSVWSYGWISESQPLCHVENK